MPDSIRHPPCVPAWIPDQVRNDASRPPAEDRRPHPHHRAAGRDRGLEVGGHAHRQACPAPVRRPAISSNSACARAGGPPAAPRNRPPAPGIVISPRSRKLRQPRHCPRQGQRFLRARRRTCSAPPSILTCMHTCSGGTCRPGAARTGAAAILSRSTRVRPVEMRGHQPRLVALDRADAMPLPAAGRAAAAILSTASWM